MDLCTKISNIRDMAKCGLHERWDYVEIRDGEDNASKSIGRFCGYSDIYFLSYSSAVFIYFVSDELQNEPVFQFEYYSAGPTDQSQCNSIVDSESYIASPGYPHSYPKSTTCIYRLIAPQLHHIELDFLQMSVSGIGCLFDRLEIYDGPTSYSPKLGTYCGNTSPDTVVSTGQEMLVIFLSDYMTEDRSFLAKVKQVIDYIQPTTQSKDGATGREQGCGTTIQNTMKGVITSPGYPNVYDNNLNCVITITSPVPDHQIMLQFTHMEVEESVNCTFDKVSLFLNSDTELPEISLCGLSIPYEKYYSKDGSMKVVFSTDSMITWSGFSANFSVIPRQVCYPRCLPDSVCVKDGNHYRCVQGSKCLTNVCNHGFCVKKGLAEVQCFCQDDYEGPFCAEKRTTDQTILAFVKTPEDQEIERGRHVILECQVNDDTAEYMWFYQDLMLQSDKGVLSIYPGGVLDIAEFDNTLEGLYKCLATTTSDFIEHEFRLTVAEPCHLSIQVPPMDTVVEEASVVLMSCYSQDNVNVTWLKDNVTVIDDHKFKVCA